ncbi:peptidase inhibitor family I36 protein [Spirillospora sp. CA-108201]
MAKTARFVAAGVIATALGGGVLGVVGGQENSTGAAPVGALSSTKAIAGSSGAPESGAPAGATTGTRQKSGSLSARVPLKCTKGRVCTWTQYNFKGDPGRSLAKRGACYHGSPFRSMKNRSSRRLHVYVDMKCRGDSYQVVRPGASVKKFRRGGNRWSYKVK